MKNRPPHHRRRSALWLATLLALAPAAPAQTTVNEIQVTPAPIPDYEFDSARNGVYCASCNFGEGNSRLTFTDAQGNLWLGQIDYKTGNFVPADGRGSLLDVNTAPVPCFGNGPEWVASAAGSQIVYTRFTDSSPFLPDGTLDCNASHTEVVVATRTASGWVKQALPFAERVTPDGTKDQDDADPRINYIQRGKDALFWARLTDPATEHPLPIDQLTGGNSRRWVPGTHKVIFQGHLPTDPRLLDQVWIYDTDSSAAPEQLTFDSVTKAGAFMWRAPEFNNEYVFFTMANFRQEIWVYRYLKGPKGRYAWTVAKKIKAPANTDAGAESKSQFFFSPEPFTHNGRSYIFTQVSKSSRFFDKSIPTQIAFSGIDPLRIDFRMLTTDEGRPVVAGRPAGRLRLDPEFLITAQGPFIYYNRLVPATDSQSDDPINEGVYRVDTKLGPPKF